MISFLAKKIIKNDEEYLQTQQKALQVVVGVLGVLLPVLLYVFLFVDNQYAKPLQSISHYYFTRVSAIFIIVVSLLAFFLLIYTGKHDKPGKINWDVVLSTLAGVGALTLLLFPTSNIHPCSPSYECSVTTLNEGGSADFRVSLHYISAAVFLACLACLSFFIFTKTHEDKSCITPEKKIRNVFFRIFGLVMAGALIVAFLEHVGCIHYPCLAKVLLFGWRP